MPRRRPQTRAPHDRIAELAELARIAGYQPDTLRKKAAAGGPDAPPLFKYRGRWCGWLTDVEQWVADQQTPVSA